ncbi:rho GTPase-activating protein SYDE1 [Osmerus mordax]|uniref:rho GTPase-activating protein SYDE1 n=1 Tax=Osmerus mordax TaxID=8014 RepID=UPI0035104820
MAEPLLKRTFSRLRGKDRSRRKTDTKLNDIQGKSDTTQSSSSSSSSAMVSAPPPAEDSSPPRTQITVAKKQQWAKQACSFRDPHAQASSLAYRSQDRESSSGKAQASPQAWSQRTVTEEGLERVRANSGCEQTLSTPPCESPSIGTGLPELTPPLAGIPEIPCSTVKLSGQGAYLQSLDRSSRAWILSTGKAQASEEARWLLPSGCLSEGRQQGLEGDKNIWYNPIPEEEDSGGGAGRIDRERDRDRENPWRRRGEAEGGGDSVLDPQTRAQRRAGLVVTADISGGAACLERHATQCPSGGASPGSAHRTTDITAENTDLLQCEPMVSASSDSPASQKKGGAASTSGGGASESPGSQKRGGGASSMIDRIKSPGTVRKLSMKMKKLPELRRKLSLRSSRSARQTASSPSAARECEGSSAPHSPSGGRKETSSNVISRYHLDTSTPARPQRRSSRGRHTSKGGYLSDGDSPELLPRQASSAPRGSGGVAGQEGGVREVSGFTLYNGADQPRCVHRVSGLLTVHLLGLGELLRCPVSQGPGSVVPGHGSTTPPSLAPGSTAPAPCRPEASKEVFCAIQVDGVTRARTSLLTCRGPALPLNHTFHLELERAKLLRLVVLSPHTPSTNQSQGQSQTRNRVCGLGAISIPPLFKASRSQQLCVRLEPRGLLYVKLTLQEQWDPPSPRPSDQQPPAVFGLELRHLVDKEGSAFPVPLLIQKCVAEIEKRGLKGVGLYRLCGSAAVKKELRDAFERDSAAVTLNEDLYPDINVITGILKDYLRELPSPLITRTLYEVVLEAMSLRPSRTADLRAAESWAADPQLSQSTVALLQCLPEPERATLSVLLDHLSLVASYSHSNRMTHQNLAVCFGPVLLTPTQEAWRPYPPGGPAGSGGSVAPAGRGGRSFAHSEEIASAVDFKRHIEALHYLLQLWPVPRARDSNEPQPLPTLPSPVTQNPLQRHCQRLPLRLDLPQDVVVSRRGRGRLESPPCNRYAGDWSVCGRDFLSGEEADYDEVAGSESDPEEEEEEEEEEEKKEEGWSSYVDDFALDFDAPFSCRLSLKDFDTLISDLERELSKQINICL